MALVHVGILVAIYGAAVPKHLTDALRSEHGLEENATYECPAFASKRGPSCACPSETFCFKRTETGQYRFGCGRGPKMFAPSCRECTCLESLGVRCPSTANAASMDADFRGTCQCKRGHACHTVADGVQTTKGCDDGGVQSTEYFPYWCEACVCVAPPPPPPVILYEDGLVRADAAAGGPAARLTMNISRQGHLISVPGTAGSLPQHRLWPSDGDSWHQEFLVTVERDDPPGRATRAVFVGGDLLCSVGLFTAPRLTCEGLPRGAGAEAESRAAGLLRGAPLQSGRAFGVELEMVGRDVPESHGQAGSPEVALERCFARGMQRSGTWSSRCSTTADCGPTDFCHAEGECRSRDACGDAGPAAEGACPVPLEAWSWTRDVSVKPLGPRQLKYLGAAPSEGSGVPFELISPPLAGKEGFRSVFEVVAGLNRMGVQTGPSQGMHVHVNVLSPKYAGAVLSARQIASIWVAWVKYQLVVDEMMSPDRPDSVYSNRLLVAGCDGQSVESCSDANPCPCAQHFFRNMHDWVATRPDADRATGQLEMGSFCNAVLGIAGSRKFAARPCSDRYPEQRYFSLNLANLNRLGTLEFRSHGATYDADRIVRYVQFLTAFVDHYSSDAGLGETAPFFDGPMERDLAELAAAQVGADAPSLWEGLSAAVDPGSPRFYMERAWEGGAGGAACSPDAETLGY